MQGLTIHARKNFLEELNSKGRGTDTGSGKRKEEGIPVSGSGTYKDTRDPTHSGTWRFRLRNKGDAIFLEYLLHARTKHLMCTATFNPHKPER